jgi:hypothetical protein
MSLGILRRFLAIAVATACVAGSAASIVTLRAQSAGINDVTIASTSMASPTTYQAESGRSVHVKPPLPPLGPAGWRFTDPTFGTDMLRVTDASTRPGTSGRSYTTPSAAHQTSWNTDSTYFYVRSVDGYFIPYHFQASTMTVSRVQATSSGDGGLLIASQAEPQFSFVSPTIVYVTRQDSTNDWPIVRQFDLATGSYSDLLELGLTAPIAKHTYTGGLSSSAGSPERVMAFFGGSAQDQHYLVAVFGAHQPQSAMVLDTTASTVTVNGATTNTNIPLGFHLHHAWLDKTGQYVILETTAPDRVSPHSSAPLYVWDTSANTFTALPETGGLSGGHYATGFGMMVNQDCCTSTTWDAAQWQLRALATPAVSHDLITPVLMPQEIYAADHSSWNNAQPGALVPFVSGFYRSDSDTAPWRAWDDEIVAVQTSAGAAGAAVWRFAHHRTTIVSFWDSPRPNVSQDGRWTLFTSNWEKTLGTDPSSGPREDVFMVALPTQATDGKGKADIAVFRPSTGTWFVRESSGSATYVWGGGADIPVAGDYDGDGKADIAVFRPSTGTWYIRYSSGAPFAALVWGGLGDVAVPGDYDGDGITDIAIFRPSTGTWYIRYSSGAPFAALVWGGLGDIAVPGDYDGDGITDVAIFRPTTGTWYIRYSATPTYAAIVWGGVGDIAVPGDYDGDGKTDIAVFRPSTGTWYVRDSSGASFPALIWGDVGDIAVPGDYDGDGKTDIAVFRPSTGTWSIRYSGTPTSAAIVWGGGGDIPIVAAVSLPLD